MELVNIALIVFLILLLLALLLIILLGRTQERILAAHWRAELRPPRIEDRVCVYVSAPLFNLSEIIYSVGIEGIMPRNNISAIDELCDLTATDLAFVRQINTVAGIPPYGIAGAIAEKGWSSYIPARDGFVLAKFETALFAPEVGDLLRRENTTTEEVSSYLVKAIFAFDVFALSSLCNCCIFNSNGLQIDDGSASEIGMIGVRGMPAVYLRSQATSQFAVGANNPMPLGNANSLINQTVFSIQDAVALLDQKLKNIKENKGEWWSGFNYDSEVSPPPLILFWIEVGEAVFNVRYKSRLIPTDPKTGFQDYKAASTDFYYANYYTLNNAVNMTTISIQIMKEIKKVENRWQAFMMVYGGCDSAHRDFSKVIRAGKCPY